MGAATVIRNILADVLPSLASNASIESKIIDAVGTVADTYVLERENTEQVIRGALASQKVTGVEYYRRKAVEFQSGSDLIYDNITMAGYYEKIVPSAQTIKQAYITGTFPSYHLLVNKIGSDGHLAALTANELSAFSTYFAAFQPLGMSLHIASLAPAVITDAGLVVYVQPGTNAATAATQINDAFKANESTLRRTNIVALSELEDIIQSVSGVKAVGWNNPTATDTLLSGSTQTVPLTDGLFILTGGAFVFGTEVQATMIKTLQ